MVQSVANAYLLVIAGSSRVQALRAQIETDQAIYDRTGDQKRAGTTAAIDVLRAHVQLEQEQQQLIAQENQVAKDKLALGRVIGLPPGQQLAITDTEPYLPLAALTLDEALHAAYEQRADFQSAQASVRAAENTVSAARAERYPNLSAAADYGDTGTTLNNSHGTFTFLFAAKFNIFEIHFSHVGVLAFGAYICWRSTCRAGWRKELPHGNTDSSRHRFRGERIYPPFARRSERIIRLDGGRDPKTRVSILSRKRFTRRFRLGRLAPSRGRNTVRSGAIGYSTRRSNRCSD